MLPLNGCLACSPCRRNSATCRHQKRHQRTGQHAGVQGKESRECVMAVLRPPTISRCNCSPTTGTMLAMFVATIVAQYPFLIPRQQVAGQRQSQHDLHQHQAEPEIHFARARQAPSITTCIKCNANSTTMACAMK